MKVVILAGGYGTRLSEYTHEVPKPMVEVGGLPIIQHIMGRYARFGHKDFFLALGYKAPVIKDYFLNFPALNSDFRVDLGSGEVNCFERSEIDWRVSLVDTGMDTMTGGRLKRLRQHIDGETFLLTYGDGVSDVDLDALIKFHRSHGKMATLTAVRPSARFGELVVSDGRVEAFEEKPQLTDGLINGGFFVFEPEFIDLIEGDGTMLEREPLSRAASMGELMAFCHNGFWQCMDTKRDRDFLESLWSSGAPWLR